MKAANFRKLFDGQFCTISGHNTVPAGTIVEIGAKVDGLPEYMARVIDQELVINNFIFVRAENLKDYERFRCIAPSVERLMRDFGECEEHAIKIRWAWQHATLGELRAKYWDTIKLPAPQGNTRLNYINHITGQFGVEFWGVHKRLGENVYGLNTGDSYNPTLYYVGKCLMLATMADVVPSLKPVQ